MLRSAAQDEAVELKVTTANQTQVTEANEGMLRKIFKISKFMHWHEMKQKILLALALQTQTYASKKILLANEKKETTISKLKPTKW
jgi:hypothetical protein